MAAAAAAAVVAAVVVVALSSTRVGCGRTSRRGGRVVERPASLETLEDHDDGPTKLL